MSSDIIIELLRNWQLPLAVGAALVYCVGYLRVSVFLRARRIGLPPTEIYGPTSLFVSGLTGLIAALIVPAVIFACGLLIETLIPLSDSIMSLSVGIIILAASFFGLPFFQMLSLPGLQIFPVVRYPKGQILLRLVASLSLAGVMFSAIEMWPLRPIIATLAAAMWLFCLLWGHVITTRDISAGMDAGRSTQDPLMMGRLITTGRIFPAGSPAPEFGNNAFMTGGLLLRWNNGVAYFVPGTYAQNYIDGYEESRLSVIPDRMIITFIHDQGS